MVRVRKLPMLVALSMIVGAPAFGAESSRASASTVTISELNIEWFGTNGGPAGGRETRGPSLRRHLHDHGLLADVMVFEEVVDLDLLKSEVLANEYECQSYYRASRTH